MLHLEEFNTLSKIRSKTKFHDPTLNEICAASRLKVRKGLKLVLLTVGNQEMLKWWW
jgi:hypothetical protein